MSRRGLSDAEHEARALEACRRTIARGESPLFRIDLLTNGSWWIVGYPWLGSISGGGPPPISVAQSMLMYWLDVIPSKQIHVEVAKPLTSPEAS
jgi:hypothetical protein